MEVIPEQLEFEFPSIERYWVTKRWNTAHMAYEYRWWAYEDRAAVEDIEDTGGEVLGLSGAVYTLPDGTVMGVK